MVLSRASMPPTVLDSESFLTITSLSHGDPTGTLPIMLGILTFANVDASRWFMTPQARLREQQVAEWTAKRRAAGETVIEPRKIFQSTLRIASVGRIIIALLVPGVSGMPAHCDGTPLKSWTTLQSIQLYWVTSAAFGLIQTWVLDWWGHRRRLSREQLHAGAEESVRPPSPEQKTSKRA